MSSSGFDELLPPPLPQARPFPWRPLLALLVPAAALAAGTGLQRFIEGPVSDPVLHWLCWSSGAGLIAGALAGLALGRRLLWTVYGAAAPWICAALVWSALHAARPLREALADRREAACRAEGHPTCTQRDFTDRCARAHADFAQSKALLGDPHVFSCNPQGCTAQWLYLGPFRPEQYSGSGALACFVVTDPHQRGIRHWLMPTDPP